MEAVTFPLPYWEHGQSHFETVYEPAEDTFILIDALEKDYMELKQSKPSICLEVGCGSGVCLTFLANMLGPHVLYMCTDINPMAVDFSQHTAGMNGVEIQPVLCDLTQPVNQRLCGSVDVLLFNPPYVVTPSVDVGSHGIQASWAGGRKGREVIDRFLPQVRHLLSPNGVLYLVTIEENDTGEIEAALNADGLGMSTVLSRRAGMEHLSVHKVSHHPV